MMVSSLQETGTKGAVGSTSDNRTTSLPQVEARDEPGNDLREKVKSPTTSPKEQFTVTSKIYRTAHVEGSNSSALLVMLAQDRRMRRHDEIAN